MDEISLFIVHPDRLACETLSAALAQHQDLVVLDTSDGHDGTVLIERAHALNPDVVLLHFAIARRHGPEGFADINAAATETRVLVTGIPNRDSDILEMIEAGAAGYETRESSLQNLVHNIRALKGGQTMCSPRIASKLFARISGRPLTYNGTRLRRGESRLTRRQLQILVLVEAGLANKEIARRLSLEVQTVKNHVHNILQKLKVRRRTEAARYARARGLLPRAGGRTSPRA